MRQLNGSFGISIVDYPTFGLCIWVRVNGTDSLPPFFFLLEETLFLSLCGILGNSVLTSL